MRIELSEFAEALNIAKMITKLDIAVEKKVAVLEEIRNALPVGMVAGAYKQLSTVVQEVISGHVAELQGDRGASRAKADSPSKETAKA